MEGQLHRRNGTLCRCKPWLSSADRAQYPKTALAIYWLSRPAQRSTFAAFLKRERLVGTEELSLRCEDLGGLCIRLLNEVVTARSSLLQWPDVAKTLLKTPGLQLRPAPTPSRRQLATANRPMAN